jgi:hypothetical protein
MPMGISSSILGMAGLDSAPYPPASTIFSSPSALPTTPFVWQWIYVRQRFRQFLDNLALTDSQRQDGETKQAGIRNCLNRYYYGYAADSANGLLIGSWGKGTQIRPPRDVDLIFLLPAEVYWRLDKRFGNKQSQLLQEVKAALALTYPQTTMRQDGQVVIVPFNSMAIEVVPGFRCEDGSIIVCDTNNGGRYITSTSEAEERDVSLSDSAWVGNTRALVRMMKQWQDFRNVPLKSFKIERLVVEFMAKWPHHLRDHFWYDWMVRDFLGYLLSRGNGWLVMPGTGEWVHHGNEWVSRAQTAYEHALKACDYERDNYGALAGREWQDIFGHAIPLSVS